MSNSFTTHAVVLKQQDLKEYDRIVTLFTLEQGKLSVLAKGIRRNTSSRSGIVQSGNYIKVQIYPHNDWYILQEATLIDSFGDFSQSTLLTGYLYHSLELLDLMVAEEASASVFRLTITFLKYMKAAPRHIYMRTFEIKLLQELGYLPDQNSAFFLTLDYEIKALIVQLSLEKWDNIASISFGEAENNKVQGVILPFIEQITEKRLKSLSFFA